jgi:hypothetical protein
MFPDVAKQVLKRCECILSHVERLQSTPTLTAEVVDRTYENIRSHVRALVVLVEREESR